MSREEAAVDVEEIKRGLETAARERAEADDKHARATSRLITLLREARKAGGLGFTEAARLGGITRQSAYELLDSASS